jgi:esterase/lipase superfamily enzyme
MAAQLMADIGNKGIMIPFAWTSKNSFFGYPADRQEIEVSLPHIRAVLVSLLQSQDIKGVQIIAHSLGVWSVVKVLKSICDNSEYRPLLTRIKEVILSVPDVDQDMMDTDFMPVLHAAKLSTTMYVSDRDVAMSISEFVNGSPRVGSIRKNIYLRPGIVTIDVSAVDQSAWGHAALFETPQVATDLFYMLRQGIPVHLRHGLSRVRTASGVYWRMES